MYRKGIYTHLLYFNALAPISQSYLQFARLLNVKNEIETLKLTYITPDKLNNPSNDYIIVNPNASDLRLERRWYIANFASLINSITQQHPTITIVLIGSANEKKYIQQLFALLKNTRNVIDTSGTLNLSQLVGWIKQCKLVITNDTGPMHIAFALNVNTVSLFGPCSPLQYGHTKNNRSFYKKMYCSPCVHDFLVPPCLGDNQCMKKITPNEVFEEVNTINFQSIYDP